MDKWEDTEFCNCRAHCETCRSDQGFRDSIRNTFEVPPDFDTVCPFGVTHRKWAPSERDPDEVFVRRVSLCTHCDHLNPDNYRCDVSGKSVRAAARVLTTGCPDGIW